MVIIMKKYLIFFALLALPIGLLIGLSSSEIISQTMAFIFVIISSLFVTTFIFSEKARAFFGDLVEQPQKILAITLFVWSLSFGIITGVISRSNLYFLRERTIDEWVEILTPQDDSINIRFDIRENDFYYEFENCIDKKEMIRLLIVKQEFDNKNDAKRAYSFNTYPFLKNYKKDEN